MMLFKVKAASMKDWLDDTESDEEMQDRLSQQTLNVAPLDITMRSQSSLSRSRRGQPPCWTRIISFDSIADYQVQMHEI